MPEMSVRALLAICVLGRRELSESTSQLFSIDLSQKGYFWLIWI